MNYADVVECTYIKPVIYETPDSAFKNKNTLVLTDDDLNMI